VEDDGFGIDPVKVKNKALQKNIITQEEADMMSSDEAVRLIFRSGFSTAAQVTDISGRGVGMDVVKTAIEGLNGTVEVKSELGKGSKFVLRLPLTLAIIRTLMVRSGQEIYAIPIEAVQENIIIEPQEIRKVQQGRVITLREEVLQLYCLKESFGLGEFDDQEVYLVMILQAGDKKVGFVVDELLGQQEVVIKSLSSFINDIRGIAGATVLGDGRVTLILDVAGLLEDGRD
jgi:two-component system chemotaxis sensor kinase CheA